LRATLDEVLRTHVLKRRVSRAPSLTAENGALRRLSQGLLRDPLEQLNDLLASALTLCNAGSAGLSLLEEENGPFRWVALAGRYKDFVGGTTPRDASPCGVTLDLGAPQLFDEPGRHFACFEHANPPIVEGLVVPVKGVGRDRATIWIVAHSRAVEFDMEDVRVMASLAGFASFACQQLLTGSRSGTAQAV
jgi:hypothetical protein